MTRFRYINDPDATRRTAANATRLLANNQLPADTAVCFRIVLRRDTDSVPKGGYAITHDTRRLEELGLMLRIHRNGDWSTAPLSPDDHRTLREITDDITREMEDNGYVLDTEDGDGFIRKEEDA